MSDLQNAPMVLGSLNQSVCVLQGVRDGFLNQHVNPCLEKLLSDICVKSGWSGDADGIHFAEQVRGARKYLTPERSGHFLCPAGESIDHAYQSRLGQGSIDSGVMLAQRAHTYDTHSNLIHP
jgi:hypothetical protein